jgi:hypothetical protein
LQCRVKGTEGEREEGRGSDGRRKELERIRNREKGR